MYTKAQHPAQRMVHESLNLKSWLVAATLHEETWEWSELMEISDSEEDVKFERSENYEKATEPKRSRRLGKKKTYTRNKKLEGLSDQLETFLIGTDAKDVENRVPGEKGYLKHLELLEHIAKHCSAFRILQARFINSFIPIRRPQPKIDRSLG